MLTGQVVKDKWNWAGFGPMALSDGRIAFAHKDVLRKAVAFQAGGRSFFGVVFDVEVEAGSRGLRVTVASVHDPIPTDFKADFRAIVGHFDTASDAISSDGTIRMSAETRAAMAARGWKWDDVEPTWKRMIANPRKAVAS